MSTTIVDGWVIWVKILSYIRGSILIEGIMLIKILYTY